MKRLAAIVLMFSLLLTAAIPALAADEATPEIPVEDVVTEGPAAVRQGEVIAVRVLVSSDNHGVSARIETAGLELLARVGGAISEDPEHRFLLEVGETGAIFFYRVTGEAGEIAGAETHDVHIIEDGADRMGTSRGWTATIEAGGSPAQGPLTFDELRNACGDVGPEGIATVNAFENGPSGLGWSGYLQILAEDGQTGLAFGGSGRTLLSEEDLESGKVATGQALSVFSKDAEPETFASIVVPGDVLGTGEFSVSQLVRLARALNGSEPLTGLYLEAGMITGGEALSVSDLVAAARILSAA